LEPVTLGQEKMRVELFEIYYVNGHLAIKLSDLAKIVKYSNSFLLRFFKKLLKKGILVAYKWKRNWYVLLPKTPIIRRSNKLLAGLTHPKPETGFFGKYLFTKPMIFRKNPVSLRKS
jgi:hypothetical protein